jgi:rhamnulose-1-phosphate aldolase/alcohol dehydrogenase
MQPRYDDTEAADFARRLGPAVPEVLALRTYTARLLGADGALVLHGGGNTSVKATVRTHVHGVIDVLYVKGSGWDLATIEPPGHPAVRLAPMLAMRKLESLGDEAMVSELRANLLDAAAPTPSVETLLHAFLPPRFIDHTHADAILAIADQPDGEAVCRRIFGPGLVWVPYVMPGFALAQRCADAFDAHVRRGGTPDVIVLERHGVFTFGESAKESYLRMISVVSRAEERVAASRASRTDPRPSPQPTSPPLVSQLMPTLRGALASAAASPTERGPILHWRSSDAILSFVARPDAEQLAAIGCATPDHVIRTKPAPLFLRVPAGDVDGSVARLLGEQLTAYAARYDAYFAEMCTLRRVVRTKLDPWPRVVLVPGVGLITVGTTAGGARIAADIYEHTIDVILGATAIGEYSPVGRGDLFDVEYWSLEQAKLRKTARAPLAEAVALVTGAASGIGAATAAKLHALGAHVVLVDRDAEGLRAVAARFAGEAGSRVTSVTADVTSGDAVRDAFAHATLTFGGVDIVVSNAGNAPIGDLFEPDGDRLLRESLELNLVAHNLVAGAAVGVFRAQGRGGCLLFNASKAAVTPGPHFGPYAVAKAALLALVRQYAVDAAPFGVRSNAVHADRVRTALFDGGVAEARAGARGLTVDAYFRSNLLAREVTAEDVADAFAYLAGARATTGAFIPVDGGNAAAFPR